MTSLQSINLNLAEKLKDKEYRSEFFGEWAKDEVAYQIRRLRKLRMRRQVDVANETGMKQSAISRIEQSEYSRWNFVTLLRIAHALDARVRVVFEPAEDVIKHYEIARKVSERGSSIKDVREAAAERTQVESNRHELRNLRTPPKAQGTISSLPPLRQKNDWVLRR